MTNVQLFSSALPTEEMQNFTQPVQGNVLKEGDLLKWQDMQFSLNGEVTQSTMNKDQLVSKGNSFVFVNKSFPTLDKCMQHCDEMVGGRVPSIVTEEEYLELVEFLSDYVSHVWLSIERSEP